MKVPKHMIPQLKKKFINGDTVKVINNVKGDLGKVGKIVLRGVASSWYQVDFGDYSHTHEQSDLEKVSKSFKIGDIVTIIADGHPLKDYNGDINDICVINNIVIYKIDIDGYFFDFPENSFELYKEEDTNISTPELFEKIDDDFYNLHKCFEEFVDLISTQIQIIEQDIINLGENTFK
jgi:hypothetical protein